MQDLRIIFMGTPDFAVGSLSRLVEAGRNVVAVVTMPDKPQGRHQDVLTPSPVKVYAQQHGIPVLQPERLRDEGFLSSLRSYAADLQVVVAFRMLPEAVWSMPPLGTINLHASLLPQYRGAAPINWALINGEKQTGVTTFLLDREIDTGLILERLPVPIHPTDNAGTLHDRLMAVGADLLLQTIDDLQAGTVSPFSQSLLAPEGVTLQPAPKLFREDCQLQFQRHTVRSAFNFVRALSPHPGAWTMLDGRQLKIFEAAEPEPETLFGGGFGSDPTPRPGTYSSDGKTRLRIACTDGWLSVLTLQIEGKRRMSVQDFLRGYVWER